MCLRGIQSLAARLPERLSRRLPSSPRACSGGGPFRIAGEVVTLPDIGLPAAASMLMCAAPKVFRLARRVSLDRLRRVEQLAQVHGDGPLQHRPDTLADLPDRRRLDVRDRRQDLRHVGRVDLGDRPAADAREDVPLHAPLPILRVPPAAPAAALLFEHAPRGLGEGRNTLGAAPVGQRVAAGAGELAVGERQLAGLGEGNERGDAESEFAAPAADDEPLNPAPGSRGLDEQVQAVTVGVPSGRGGTDEGGRERLLGMASLALGSAGSRQR